jgi:hypothetical protein
MKGCCSVLSLSAASGQGDFQINNLMMMHEASSKMFSQILVWDGTFTGQEHIHNGVG